MIQISRHRFSLMVLYAIGIHLNWAVGLLINPNAVNITAMTPFVQTLGIPVWALPAMFILVALLALIALMPIVFGRISVVLMLPQQATLMISAYGAIHATWLGQFGDGVVRDHMFIYLDQVGAPLAAIGHTLAIIWMGKPEWRV